MHAKPHRTVRPRVLAATLVMTSFAVLAVGCSRQDAGGRYRATIVRTAFGIPHITADDLGSLGFGEGYAQAQDHLCSVADQVVRARGERSRYFGRGEDDANFQSDVTMKALQLHERAANDLAGQSEEIRGWYDGYVAGYNQYLEETGVDQVPGWCRGADWVHPITAQDLAAYHRLFTITSTNMIEMIAQAEPPTAGAGPSAGGAMASFHAAPTGEAIDRAFDEGTAASNGWALGRDRSESGRGMLIANPHYPWVGSNRFWEKQLTIPGKLDVYGVGLIGIPGVAIGFNRAVAWTHTVSAGKRFTLYSLDLVPDNPTRYRYDGGEREMSSRTVTVDVKGDTGTEPVTHTVWFSHYGPMLDFPGLGWTAERAFTLRDANDQNDEGRLQWLAMDEATSLAEFQQAHAQYDGMPWVNTIATSAEGTAWYADTSATPNLSPEALADWQERKEHDPLTARMAERGIVMLDGSDSKFEWIDDEGARDPGILAFSHMPQIERSDYVFNANDSYWLPNSQALITGYSPLQGGEATQRSLRTRNNDLTLSLRSPDQPAGDNERFNLDELGNAILSNRSYTAELLKPELVERCRATPSVRLDGESVDLSQACSVLDQWNDRFDLEARGAVLFREWIGQYEPVDLGSGGRLFAVPFDPQRPIDTPSGLASGGLALENLARAVRLLAGRGIALDTPLGDLQYADKAGRHIPIHGGHGAYEGLLNMQQNGRNATTLEPMDNPPLVAGSRFLTEKGYPVSQGSSFLMALEYTDAGPHAKAFLTYSESGDPTSPHFTDQTERFSRKEWRPILFERSEVDAQKVSEVTVTGPRPGA